MTDEFEKRIKDASPAWLREQIVLSNRLIHESEQLLRGAGPGDAPGLRSAIWTEKANRRRLQVELDWRNGDVR